VGACHKTHLWGWAESPSLISSLPPSLLWATEGSLVGLDLTLGLDAHSGGNREWADPRALIASLALSLQWRHRPSTRQWLRLRRRWWLGRRMQPGSYRGGDGDLVLVGFGRDRSRLIGGVRPGSRSGFNYWGTFFLCWLLLG
jgi:hypothetical protein